MENPMTSPEAAQCGRRTVLKAMAGGLATLSLFEASMLLPAYAADAKDWPTDAFKQKSETDALKLLYGKSAAASDKVNLDAPEIAENGAVVPIAVTSTLPNVTGVALLVVENPYTLAAAYKIPEGTQPAVASRLKMAKTTKVVAVVESDGKLFTASKDVKVTVGGCGG
jgi:sulfur-oxidizing protein SoxY